MPRAATADSTMAKHRAVYLRPAQRTEAARRGSFRTSVSYLRASLATSPPLGIAWCLIDPLRRVG